MADKEHNSEWISEVRNNESREDSLRIIENALEKDSDNALLWVEAADLSLPPRSRGKPIDPTLSQSANALRCLRSAVECDPSMDEAWALGGLILVDHLGMLEDALEWWSNYREVNPESPAPLIEQASILARYGDYDKASQVSDQILLLEGSSLSTSQKRRLEDIRRSLHDATKKKKGDIFRPQDPNDQRWGKISKFRNQKPVTQTYFLFFIIAPFVFMIGFVASASLSSYGTGGQVATFMTILIAFYTLTRASEPLFRWMNRNATDLDRALDIEMASGKTCIPEDIRGGRLHKKMLTYRPPAWLERHEKIVAGGQRISRKWSTEFKPK